MILIESQQTKIAFLYFPKKQFASIILAGGLTI